VPRPRKKTKSVDARNATQAPAAARRRKPTVSRAEKSEAIRRALLEAAGTVVGRHGYAGASIARITMAANVAQGTFYNYFDSRHALFAQLLPEIGQFMIDEIGAKVRQHTRLADREEARIRGYLQFLRTHPGFYRVLREAETFAPEAHRAHMANMVAGYGRALRAERERAGAPPLPDQQIEKIVYMLLGARDYLAMQYQEGGNDPATVDDETVATYMRALRGGLFDDIPDDVA